LERRLDQFEKEKGRSSEEKLKGRKPNGESIS